MDANEEPRRGKLGEVEFRTSPSDAPITYVDGIKGVMVQQNVTKISFFQQVLDTEAPGLSVLGRHVVTLAIPNEQLAPIANLIKQVSDENSNAAPPTGAEK